MTVVRVMRVAAIAAALAFAGPAAANDEQESQALANFGATDAFAKSPCNQATIADMQSYARFREQVLGNIVLAAVQRTGERASAIRQQLDNFMLEYEERFGGMIAAQGCEGDEVQKLRALFLRHIAQG